MQEFLSELDDKLEYVSHEYIDKKSVLIECKVKRGEVNCIYCGKVSNKVNCKYIRKVKDLPFGDRQVVLRIWFNNYFCNNDECGHKTFAEQVEFVSAFSTRTKRLEQQILDLCSSNSGIGTERYLKRNIGKISDTTVNRIVKKNSQNKL